MTATVPSRKLEELLVLLDLERIEKNLFRALHPAGRTRLTATRIGWDR
jgi:hypothetical protein